MKRNLLILTVAAQLAVGGAFAQTDTTAGGTADLGTSSGTFGSDWSTTLGMAMFSDGDSTVRSESELASQWDTLSDEDKDMIRRDCMEYNMQSDASMGSMGTTDVTTDSTGTTTETTGDTTSSIGAGSDSTDTDMSAGTDSMDTTGTTGMGSTGMGSGGMMTVSMEQMEEICAATDDL